MKNTRIRGTGTSRKLKAPADMPTNYTTFRSQMMNGQFTADLDLNPAGCYEVGTPLNKENLLSDQTAAEIAETPPADPTVNWALSALRKLIADVKAVVDNLAIWKISKVTAVNGKGYTVTVERNSCVKLPWLKLVVVNLNLKLTVKSTQATGESIDLAKIADAPVGTCAASVSIANNTNPRRYTGTITNAGEISMRPNAEMGAASYTFYVSAVYTM